MKLEVRSLKFEVGKVVSGWGVFVRVGFDRVAKLHKFRGVYPDQMSEYVSG